MYMYVEYVLVLFFPEKNNNSTMMYTYYLVCLRREVKCINDKLY